MARTGTRRRFDALALVKAAYHQRRHYPGEATDVDLPDTLEELIALKGDVDAVASAAREVSRQAGLHIMDRLGAHGLARFGPTFYRVSYPRDTKIRPEAQSRFWSWVKAHDMAPRLFNPNAARTTGLAALKKLPDPETGEILSASDWDEAFLDVTHSEQLKLEEIPETKMNRWQQKLPDGYVQTINTELITENEGDNDATNETGDSGPDEGGDQ